jgi:hypothetical protein
MSPGYFVCQIPPIPILEPFSKLLTPEHSRSEEISARSSEQYKEILVAPIPSSGGMAAVRLFMTYSLFTLGKFNLHPRR